MYMFDEPSSYLDVRQRIAAAVTIRELIQDKNFIIVVEHDLSICDFLRYGEVLLCHDVSVWLGVLVSMRVPCPPFTVTSSACCTASPVGTVW